MIKLEYLFKIIYLLKSGNMLIAKAIGDRLSISERNARAYAYANTLMNPRRYDYECYWSERCYFSK